MLRVNFSVVDENSGTYLMNNKFVKDVEIKAGLSLTVSCRQNSPAEKEVIAGLLWCATTRLRTTNGV